jgi:hypothetical protein
MPKTVEPGKSYDVDLIVTPQISADNVAPTTVEISIEGTRAKLTFDKNKSKVLDYDSLTKVVRLAITMTIPSDLTSGSILAEGHAEAANIVKAVSARPFSITVKKKTTPPSTGGTSGGSTGSGSASNVGSIPPSGTGTTTTGNNGGAVLPPITQQPPTTAPEPTTTVQQASNSQSMRNSAEGSDELSFNQLASTQAAWLAALLVAFSLLLTQVRLGKASGKVALQKGAHRKTRKQAGRFRAS